MGPPNNEPGLWDNARLLDEFDPSLIYLVKSICNSGPESDISRKRQCREKYPTADTHSAWRSISFQQPLHRLPTTTYLTQLESFDYSRGYEAFPSSPVAAMYFSNSQSSQSSIPVLGDHMNEKTGEDKGEKTDSSSCSTNVNLETSFCEHSLAIHKKQADISRALGKECSVYWVTSLPSTNSFESSNWYSYESFTKSIDLSQDSQFSSGAGDIKDEKSEKEEKEEEEEEEEEDMLVSFPAPIGQQNPPTITALADIPMPNIIASFCAASVTVNLIVGIISITPPFLINTRYGPREIVELIVGDETKAGFNITFWLSSCGYHNDHGDDSSSRKQQKQDIYRDALEKLRRQDVVLLRNVALSAFRKTVHGTSLRDHLTKIYLLHRRQQVQNDIYEEKEENVVSAVSHYRPCDVASTQTAHPQLDKTRRVVQWTLCFVGPQQCSCDKRERNLKRPRKAWKWKEKDKLGMKRKAFRSGLTWDKMPDDSFQKGVLT